MMQKTKTPQGQAAKRLLPASLEVSTRLSICPMEKPGTSFGQSDSPRTYDTADCICIIGAAAFII